MNIDQFEPLGSNCEFGFVLRKLGNNRPSLFRWTAISVSSLITLLDARFERCFDRDLIRPHTSSMVKSLPYDWAFHSALHSSPDGQFTAPPARFERLFEIERTRIHNEIEMFTNRLRNGGIIATYSGPSISDGEAHALLAAIDNFSGNDINRLLAVSPDSIDAPKVREISPRCLRATVGWLAPYDQADAADYEGWQAIVTQVLVSA